MLWIDRLRHSLLVQPDRIALVWAEDETPTRQLTYADLEDEIARAAQHLLQSGLQPGDHVVLFLPKSLSFIFYHLASLFLGAVSLPVNPSATADELIHFLTDSAARLIVVDGSSGDLPELLCESNDVHIVRVEEQPRSISRVPYPSLAAGQTAMMIYTSGTTGRPKAAEITNANLSAQLDALHTAWGWQPDDRLLHALPLFHVHGLIVALHGALNAGATTILIPHFHAPTVLRLLSGQLCTVFMGVPTMYYRLIDTASDPEPDLSLMRLFTCGSDRLSENTFHAFHDRFQHTILERYGMTETGMLMSNPLVGERRPGSVGQPLPGVEARIVDPASGQALPDREIGEVQVRGANIFKGYWDQPELTKAAFAAGGWFRTGDLGMRDADGYYWLKGRAKDLIISGGYNVYPAEIERVILEHPALAACTVIGCPDDEWGEKVIALIVLAPDQQHDREMVIAEVKERCRVALAPYKRPRSVQVLAELPRNALGKVVKSQLRQWYCRQSTEGG